MSEGDKNQDYLKELILKAKSGDTEAFEDIYSTYYVPLFRYIVSRIKDKSEAEDITQTVFIKIWNHIPNWNDNHTSPLSFFFTVARNTMIDYFRKNSHREIISDEIVNKLSETTESIVNPNENVELDHMLKEAISNLSEEQQEIINLFYVNDRSYKEIAEITGKREDAIRQTHSRAIKKLRSIYEN